MRENKTLIAILILFLLQVGFSAAFEYDQYQEKNIFKGTPTEPNLATHKDARKYKTVLRQ
jgi:hypothetical protein